MEARSSAFGRLLTVEQVISTRIIYGRLPANNGQSAQIKTTPEGAAFDYLLSSYAFFRLATPIKPIRPEPNSQTAAGTGTGLE